MIPNIFPILSGSVPVTALVGSNPVRIFPFEEATEGVTYPYVTWTVITGTPANTLDKLPVIDYLSTQVDIWGKTSASALDVAAAVRDAIEPHAHMVGLGSMERDLETKSYRVRLDFDFFIER